MEKITYLWCLLFFVILGCGTNISHDSVTVTLPSVLTTKPDDEEVEIPEKAEVIEPVTAVTLQQIYLSQLYVRELTGKNDGVDVEKYLRSTGLPKGNPWCAAFVHWCLEEADIPNKVTAWSPTAENKGHIVYRARQQIEEPEPGDVVTFYYANLGRVGHAGFYNKKISNTTYESVEGNTNGAGSREGNGVYKKYRSFNATHSISRWPATPN